MSDKFVVTTFMRFCDRRERNVPEHGPQCTGCSELAGPFQLSQVRTGLKRGRPNPVFRRTPPATAATVCVRHTAAGKSSPKKAFWLQIRLMGGTGRIHRWAPGIGANAFIRPFRPVTFGVWPGSQFRGHIMWRGHVSPETS